jgi:hypothetical protein
MAYWITIYCADSVPAINLEEMRKGISSADWWTLGEDFDLEEDEVDAFMDHLIWTTDPLAFGLKDERPVRIHVWNDPARIKEEIEELEDRMPPSVAGRIGKTKSIVALELGISQVRTMNEVVGFEIAYWFSETKNGLIMGPYDSWFDHAEHRWDPIET